MKKPASKFKVGKHVATVMANQYDHLAVEMQKGEIASVAVRSKNNK